MVAAPFRDGTIAEAPVLPGTGMFMPAGTARLEGQGPVPPRRAAVRRRALHRLHGVHAGLPGRRDSEHGARHPRPAADRHPAARPPRRAARGAAGAGLSADRGGARKLQGYQGEPAVARSRRGGSGRSRRLERHRAAQCREAGRGAGAGSRSRAPGRSSMPWRRRSPAAAASIPWPSIPWKCSGCMECIDVCGPGALQPRVQDDHVLDELQERFEFLSRTANTPARFVDGAVRPDGDIKRMMLDRANYYATTGGHGACRGCGEVTAIRLVMSANHAIQGKRRKEHIARGREPDRASSRPSVRPCRTTRPAASASTPRWRRWRSGCTCSRAARPATARPRRSSPTPPVAAASMPRRSRSIPTTTRGSTACSRTRPRWPRACSKA